ncbi:MAG TPA: hypothetical protein VGC80_03830, partial [Acetobacteraceae bacterium]
VAAFRRDFPAYDGAALAWNHGYLVDQENRLLDFLARLDRVTVVNYEALEAKPLDHVRSLGAFLGVPVPAPLYVPEVLKMRGARALAQHSRFTAAMPEAARPWHPDARVPGHGTRDGIRSMPQSAASMASVAAAVP